MANNYPSDPQNAAPAGNLATPQSGSGGTPPLGSSYGNQSSLSTSDAVRGKQRRLPAGVQLSSNRYKIERLIASGGMGAVYLATDQRFGRPCAVKEMLDDFHNDAERTQSLDWFRREATLLLDINHASIPHVRDFFMEDGRHYLVMDFIEGRTLNEVLEKEGNVPGLNGARGLPEERVRSWAQQLCSVLGYLHRQNPPIIFRDLKPPNIMVTDKDEIKLIDFGIARTVQSQQISSTVIMTIGYAPPEQLQGRPEMRSDLYSLGATLHRLLTRHDASNNKPTIFSFPPVRTLRPDISPGLEEIISKALATNIDDRWANAAEMERAVLNLPPLSSQVGNLAPTVLGNLPDRPVTGQSGLGVFTGTGGFNGPGGVFLRSAQDHLAAGRIEAAFGALDQAYNREPDNALLHKMYGQAFARRQPPQPDLALKAYNSSLLFNGNDPETHRLVGDVYLYVRHVPSLAIPAYMQALRLNSRDFEAHRGLAKSYEDTNQLALALQEYQEAAGIDGKLFSLHYSIGQVALRLNRLQVAELAFVRALTINPAESMCRFVLAQVYEREGKLEEALRQCQYVVNSVPTPLGAPDMLRRLHSILGH